MKSRTLLFKPGHVLAIAIGSILLLFLAYGRFRESQSVIHAFDTGLYLQLLENLRLYGDFASSITGEKNFLAHHFQPIIIAILPFHLVFPSVTTLFMLDALAIGLCVWLLYRHYVSRFSAALIGGFVLGMVLHPAIASRVFYSFVPETLALPLLAFQAIILSRTSPLSRKDLVFLILAQFFSGMCKETLWLVNGTVALLLAWRFRSKPWIYLGMFFTNSAIFSFLFFSWMPAHTAMTQYYGMRYFSNPEVQGTGLIAQISSMLLNLASGQSLNTLFFNVIALSGVVPFLSWNPSLLAAAPGLFLILASSHPLIHQAPSHHLILALPFLWASGLESMKDGRLFNSLQNLRKWLPAVFVILPLTITLPNGIKTWMDIANEPRTNFIRQDVEKIRQSIHPEQAVLLVDGNLQPLLADYRNVSILLEFVGNPHKVTDAGREEISDVITAFNPRNLNSCRDLKKSGEDSLDYDYEAFYSYCEWIKREPFVLVSYPDSNLYHFHRDRLP